MGVFRSMIFVRSHRGYRRGGGDLHRCGAKVGGVLPFIKLQPGLSLRKLQRGWSVLPPSYGCPVVYHFSLIPNFEYQLEELVLNDPNSEIIRRTNPSPPVFAILLPASSTLPFCKLILFMRSQIVHQMKHKTLKSLLTFLFANKFSRVLLLLFFGYIPRRYLVFTE